MRAGQRAGKAAASPSAHLCPAARVAVCRSATAHMMITTQTKCRAGAGRPVRPLHVPAHAATRGLALPRVCRSHSGSRTPQLARAGGRRACGLPAAQGLCTLCSCVGERPVVPPAASPACQGTETAAKWGDPAVQAPGWTAPGCPAAVRRAAAPALARGFLHWLGWPQPRLCSASAPLARQLKAKGWKKGMEHNKGVGGTEPRVQGTTKIHGRVGCKLTD